MKPRKIIKTLSIVLCLSLMCASLSGCNGKGSFYSGAKKHLKDKYGVTCKSLLYYEYPNDMAMGASFGLIELDNGDRVVVSLADGNYADNYEFLEMYEAWMDELSIELGVNVVYLDVDSDGTITFGNTAKEDRTIGSFLERSTKRYNASNVDEFVYDFYDFTYYEDIEVYIVKKNPSEEWMEDLADKLEAYRNKVGAKEISASVFEEFSPLRTQIYPDDFFRMANGNGREYAIRFDWSNYHRYKDHKYKDKTICITQVFDK